MASFAVDNIMIAWLCYWYEGIRYRTDANYKYIAPTALAAAREDARPTSALTWLAVVCFHAGKPLKRFLSLGL